MGRKRTDRENDDEPTAPGPTKPEAESAAGNAIYDPAEQTRRRDIPAEEQVGEGETLRGSDPA